MERAKEDDDADDGACCRPIMRECNAPRGIATLFRRDAVAELLLFATRRFFGRVLIWLRHRRAMPDHRDFTRDSQQRVDDADVTTRAMRFYDITA